MPSKIRKIVRFEDQTFIEGGKKAPVPLRLFGVAAVIANPWAGQGSLKI